MSRSRRVVMTVTGGNAYCTNKRELVQVTNFIHTGAVFGHVESIEKVCACLVHTNTPSVLAIHPTFKHLINGEVHIRAHEYVRCRKESEK